MNKDAALRMALEFNKRFTSMNAIDAPENIQVSRDEWRELFSAIKEALPEQEPARYPTKA